MYVQKTLTSVFMLYDVPIGETQVPEIVCST